MEFREGQTVGIDLGTTFSSIAQLDEEGNPVSIPNEDDDVETPSLVLLAEGGHVIVGPNRMRAAMEDPDHVVERIKRHMGETQYKRTFDGKEITPEFLSALILKKLRQDTEKRIGQIGNAVITVPYYFNDVRRKATQDAGRIAGIHVIDIINEPTAATLTYAWHRGELGAVGPTFEKPRTALVYDLGGGTFDVTVVRYTPTHFRVLATDGDVQLGGVDWNDRLLDHVCEEFKSRHGKDPRDSVAAVHVLRNDCDLAKLELSDNPETKIACRHEGKSITVAVTQDQFEAMTADLLQRTADTTELVLQQAGISAKALDALVMVGGATLMPQVPRMLKDLLGKEPHHEISPHTAVAQGAAIHAAILEVQHLGEKSALADKVHKMLTGVKQENVNSHGLGVLATNPRSRKDVNHLMIPRNTPLPAEVKRTFKTKHDKQQRVSVQVIEGDAPDPAACSLLGKCRITDLPVDLPRGSLVEVTYAFDTSGRILVSARDKTGGKEASIEIERRSGLSEAQIDVYTKLANEYMVE
ncbi:MAG: Hsp70 family protein [Pirellulales bacterium]|nr:Hsp70 family protein [Pirellulales bacterium]